MAKGTQKPATGFAKQFANYLERARAHHGYSIDALAKKLEMSKNYVAERLRGEKPFTVQDLELAAKAFGTTPDELAVRISLPEAVDIDDRLVPGYEVVSTPEGKTIYLVEPADPQPRGKITDISTRRRVRPQPQNERSVASDKSKDRGEGQVDT